jgi:hypothetical protein
MMPYLSLAGIVLTVLAAVVAGRYGLLGQRLQTKTQERVAQVQQRSEESRMALDMAIEVRDRLDVLEGWEDDVLEWWDSTHRPRDEWRDRELLRLAPDLSQSLPPLESIPRPRRRPRD